ncbi:MAG: RHS repeat protein [Chryseobacterium sp.]|jgi:YD repeat-containing protein|uniref:RHS repeat domain-containing protein n=1 Tax=Chryseobacterium sp. TaxID=1871047 RepID=UPI002825FA66|nr:RHS repeat domain-containing protein [Chryseobacterium sp.]MDR2236615.1 RHS repeat protein [Chryseobacterium sp.]
MMKRILTYFTTIFTILGINEIYAQNNFNPEPTSSSIESYIKYEASTALGVPSVDIPLYKLESDDKRFPITLSLSYHLYNSRSVMAPTEVGLGWTLFKGAIISKESNSKNNEYTEINDLTKQNSDRFYYNIPGYSGMFQIYKDTATNELKLFDLSASKLRIEFIRDQTSSKLIINSFKITDDKGLIYNFNNYNITAFQNHYLQDYKNQRTSYLPTTITDANNRTLVTYSYDLKTKTTFNPYGSIAIKYKINKLNTITTSKGKLKFEYDYNEAADNGNKNKEYYTINNISLFSKSDKLISRISLDIDNIGLKSLKKFDSNSLQVENTWFKYGNGSETEYGYIDDNGSHFGVQPCSNGTEYINPQEYVYKVLTEIHFPTGGRVEYAYEANEEFMDYSNKDYENADSYSDPFNQYYGIKDNIVFDTNITREYSFVVHGNTGRYPVIIKRGFEEGVDYGFTNHGQPIPFTFSVLNSNNTVMSTDDTNSCTSTSSSKFYKLAPGTYKIKINSWGGSGDFNIVGLKSVPKPYKNFHPVYYGARVKRITYYEGSTILKQKKYEYNSFTDPISSTGVLIDDPVYPYVLYKNVRETEISGNQTNGYTDYYYKTPYEYFVGGNYNILYFNLVSHGILTSKKIYNSQNQLLNATEYINNFTEIPNAQPQISGYHQYIPAYISSKKEINTVRRGNSDFITTKETNFSLDNFQEVYSKITSHNGDTQETITKYAQDLSDTRLINANMISIPLETVIKDNGNILSIDKTIFGNTTNFYPSAVENKDLAQNPEVQATFDIYDDKGNLIQVTNKAGISTTTIWGYYQTLPIAQIVGAKYNDISALPVITAAIAASNADADNSSNEAALLTALENLQMHNDLKQYPVTVYTYDPLIGLTNSVSSNGLKTSYNYDASGRLITVKDGNGKVLKENQYNYKHY